MTKGKTSIKLLMILGMLLLMMFVFNNNIANASTGSKEEIEEVSSNLTKNGIYVDLTVSEQIDKWADNPWYIDTSDIKGLSLPEGYSIGIAVLENGNRLEDGTVTLLYNGKTVNTIHNIVPVKYKDTDKRVKSVEKDVESLREYIMEKVCDNEGNTSLIYKYTENINGNIPTSLIKKANKQLILDISKMSTMENATFKMVGTPTDEGTDELYCIVGIFIDDVYYDSLVCMQKLVKVDKIDISKVKISRISNQTYTGTEIKPSVIVKNEKATLKNESDYTILYKNNKNTGKATATITGKGFYTGTKSITFNIIPSQVKYVKVKSQKEKQITLNWSKNAGKVTGYKIYQYNSKNKKWNYIGKTSNTNYTIKNLTSGITYKFKLSAYITIDKKDCEGPCSAVITTSTIPSATKLKTLTTKK